MVSCVVSQCPFAADNKSGKGKLGNMTITSLTPSTQEGIGAAGLAYARAAASDGAWNAEATVSFTLLKTLAVVLVRECFANDPDIRSANVE